MKALLGQDSVRTNMKHICHRGVALTYIATCSHIGLHIGPGVMPSGVEPVSTFSYYIVVPWKWCAATWTAIQLLHLIHMSVTQNQRHFRRSHVVLQTFISTQYKEGSPRFAPIN